MSQVEHEALPTRMTATLSEAISDGHEIEIDAMHANVNLVDVDVIELSNDLSRKRAISHVSDGSDIEVVLKKRRGRPAKSAPYHVRKPRHRKQKDAEKKSSDVVDDTDIHEMIDVGVQTDVCELNVLSSVASTAVLTDSISKIIKEAIDPVTTELQFTTIDIKELLVTLHQLASQVQLLSAAVASLSVKKPPTIQSQSDAESSDSDIVEGIAEDWTRVTRGLKKCHKGNADVSHFDSVQLNCDPRQTHDNAEKNFMASMYRDLELKERRSKNIILSGMPYSRVSDDFTAATNMLAEEFDLHYIPTVSCRRLGRPIEGRRQLLLVTMETRQDADYFIANARYLRHSRDPEVRNHVYISADLTPAESKAAYDLRCRRRQQKVIVERVCEQATRGDNRQPAASNAAAAGVSPPVEVVTVDVHASFNGDGRPGKM
jgi:hypothetical protein